jgi:8-oxo-dGTP diphosphatase
VTLEPSEYPHLLGPTEPLFGPVPATFEFGLPDEALIGNVNIVPSVGDEWLITRQEEGWSVTSGTLEPGESWLEAARREMIEEAGAELQDLTLFGGWRIVSTEDRPYRPHMPHPVSYRVVGYGEAVIVGAPTNPEGEEQILEVATWPLHEACRRLEQSPEGFILADTLPMAAALKNGA